MFPSALLRFHALLSITSNAAVQSASFGMSNHFFPGLASVIAVFATTATIAWFIFASSTLIIKWFFCFCRTASVYLSHHPRPPTMRVGFKSDECYQVQEIIGNADMLAIYELLELCRPMYDEMMEKHPLLFTDGSDIRELYRRCNAYHLPTDVFRLVDELDAFDQLPTQAPKKKRVKKLDTLDGSYWTATPTKRRTRQTTKKSPTPSPTTVRRSARIAARNAVV